MTKTSLANVAVGLVLLLAAAVELGSIEMMPKDMIQALFSAGAVYEGF